VVIAGADGTDSLSNVEDQFDDDSQHQELAIVGRSIRTASAASCNILVYKHATPCI
jgi:hypothetical protein